MSGPILFCGDPHGRFAHIVRAAQELNASAVVLLGDLEPRRALHEELGAISDKTWFIHGNHDTDSEQTFRNVWDSDMAVRNLHGRVAVLPDGTRVAGLGGIFRSKVWMPPDAAHFETVVEHRERTPAYDRWRHGPSLRNWSSIYPETVDQLAALEADLLVTHEAPSCHPHGFEIIDDLARAMRLKVVFHGHHHDRLDYRSSWERLGFRAHGVGLRGITRLDGEVVVMGELDLARGYRRPRHIDEPT